MDSKRYTASSNTHKLLPAILLSGIIARFVQQFVFPVFNVDEIDLALNIMDRDFAGLLYPLDFYQSSPPLFLLLQKSVLRISIIPAWIALKLISFLAAVASLYLFYRLIRNLDWAIASLMLLVFAFNPFISYNSLTLKQYTIDLLGILLLLNFYRTSGFKKYAFLFFGIWCLISNIGLFGCAGCIMYLFFEQKDKFGIAELLRFLKKNILLFVAPLPYLIYFYWFIQQDGSIALKQYMQVFWQHSFIPLNMGIFKYLAYLAHSIWVYFLNYIEIIGMSMMAICGIGMFAYSRKKETPFQPEITLLLFIIGIHFFFNLIHLYPLSDRLCLYMTPFFLLLYGIGWQYLTQNWKFRKPAIIIIALITVTAYSTYGTKRDNNIVAAYAELSKVTPRGNAVYASEKAISKFALFNKVTENYFVPEEKPLLIPIDKDLKQSDYLMSRVQHMFGTGDRSSDETAQIQQLIDTKKISLVSRVDGYAIYKVNHQR